MIPQSECLTAKQSFQQTIARFIDRSNKTQVEIARALGYENANIITMFKKGTTRVPPQKVVPLALAVGQDPGSLLRQWFDAYMPDVLPHITNYLGRPMLTDAHAA